MIGGVIIDVNERELVVNENVLLPEYVPDRLPGREREIEDIAHNFRVALNGRKPENMLVYGPPGTGKTAVLKYVMRELGEYSAKVRIVYVNCWHAGTRYGVFGEIARAAGYIAPMKGKAVEDVIRRVAEIIKKRNMFIVVVLDEMDRLIASGHGDVLYDLSRMNETFGAKVSVVGIVNDIGLVARLDSRIRSSVIDRDIEFRPYTVPQLKSILMERARAAFSNFDEEAVGLCAAYAYKMNGDARSAISLLLAAGRVAERAGKQALDIESVERAAERSAVALKSEKSEVELGEVEKRIIDILREKGEIRSGELYKLMDMVSERTLRNYIKKLENSGIVETVKDERRGKSRVIRIKKGEWLNER